MNTQYIACAVSSGGNTTGYVNGLSANPVAFGVTVCAANYTWAGGRPLASTERWGGLLDFIMLWNRALSSQEVSYLTAFPFAMFDPISYNQFDPSIENTLSVAGNLPRRRF